MILSSRVKDIAESITLILNEKANSISESGRAVYNLTAGQLPSRPAPEFIDNIKSELNFLKSFQYSPVAGHKDIRKKIIERTFNRRQIDYQSVDCDFDCVISNGAKHTIYNILGALVDPGDEVVLFAPYWISYPEMIKFWGGVPQVVNTNVHDVFNPPISEIKKIMSRKTRAIILNSPNNPGGIHYSEEWMSEFAQLLLEYPDVVVISDEIYFDLYYYDPAPTYFYQKNQDLLKRTIIVDGISKSLACTGLRIGYCIGPKDLCDAVTKLQAQTTSGANSLIQRALASFDWAPVEEYLFHIKGRLRGNSQIIQHFFRENNLSHCWYQTTSAFYFMVDFTSTPVYKKYVRGGEEGQDFANQICEDLLEKYAVAIVPGSDFGMPNSGRISLVLEKEPFAEAISKLVKFLTE